MARVVGIIVTLTLFIGTAEAQGSLSELISLIRAESPRQSDSLRVRIAEITGPYMERKKDLAEADWKAIDSGLSDADSYVRGQTGAILAMIMYTYYEMRPIRLPDATRDLVAARFVESNPNVRGNAVRAIAVMAGGVPANLGTQLRQMARTDVSYDVRGVAMAALASINPPDPETNEFWVQSLNNVSDKRLRGMVLSAFRLKAPSDPRVISLVIDALKDPDRFVRQEAIAAIRKLGKPAESAIPLLIDIRNDPSSDDSMRDNAEAAIRVLTLGK